MNDTPYTPKSYEIRLMSAGRGIPDLEEQINRMGKVGFSVVTMTTDHGCQIVMQRESQNIPRPDTDLEEENKRLRSLVGDAIEVLETVLQSRMHSLYPIEISWPARALHDLLGRLGGGAS